MHCTVRRVAGVADPADQQRHVRALAAPVGVQLVEDQEPQAPGRLDQAAGRSGRVRTSSSIT